MYETSRNMGAWRRCTYIVNDVEDKGLQLQLQYHVIRYIIGRIPTRMLESLTKI